MKGRTKKKDGRDRLSRIVEVQAVRTRELGADWDGVREITALDKKK